MSTLSVLDEPLLYTVVDVTPDTDKWKEARRESIGASEVAAIMGLSPYSTPLEVFNSKMGVDPDFPPLLGLIGHLLEDDICELVAHEHPEHAELLPGFMARSTVAPWIHATLDRLTLDGKPFQLKTVSDFDRTWDGGLPQHVQVQEQVEMFVKGADEAFVGALIGARRVEVHHVKRDQDFIDLMTERTAEFWNLVTNRTPPEPSTTDEARKLWVSSERPLIPEGQLALDLIDLHGLYGDLLAERGATEVEMEAVKLKVQQVMREHDTILIDDIALFTWKADAKGTRRFLYKDPKEMHDE